jgi:hypothetical protein
VADYHPISLIHAIAKIITKALALRVALHMRSLLGNSGKTLHHRNVGFAETHEISFQVMYENDSRIWLLRVNLLSISG